MLSKIYVREIPKIIKSFTKKESYFTASYLNAYKVYAPYKFYFSIEYAEKKNASYHETFYFYYGWLQQPQNMKLFQQQAEKVVFGNYQSITKNNDNEILAQVIKSLIHAEENLFLNYKIEAQFKKWETRKQLRKAILLNLRSTQNLSNIKLQKIRSCFEKIYIFQAEIADFIIDYIKNLPPAQKSSYRNFLANEKNYNDEILDLINKKWKSVKEKMCNSFQYSQEIENYLLDEFKCLFNLNLENYSEIQIKSVQKRYSEGMVNDEIAFFVTPVTATVFNFLFQSHSTLDGLSATKRIGKSHGALLARILSSYSRKNKFFFFQNIMGFDKIQAVNIMLVKSIRNSLYNHLDKSDFKILNPDYLTQLQEKLISIKKLDQISPIFENFQKELNLSLQNIHRKIISIQISDYSTSEEDQKQKEERLKIKQNSKLENLFFTYNQDQILHLVHFKQLLDLIASKKRKRQSILVLDQFNFVGRLIYEIIGLKYSGEDVNNIEVKTKKKIGQLALIQIFIRKTRSVKIRFLASLHNFDFEKLLSIIDNNFIVQRDSYTLFGFNFSEQNAKFQLEWELKKLSKKIQLRKQQKFQQVNKILLEKSFINKVINNLLISLTASGVRLLASQLYKNSIQKFKKNQQDFPKYIEDVISISLSSVHLREVSFIYESFEKFVKQFSSQKAQQFKLKMLIKANQFFILNKLKDKTFTLQQFHQKIGSTFRKNAYFHYMTTFLCLFKFYKVFGQQERPMDFHHTSHFYLWIVLMEKYNNLYFTQLLLTKNLNPEDLKSSQFLSALKTELGTKIEFLFLKYFKMKYDLQEQIYLTDQSFKIDQIILQSSSLLNLQKELQLLDKNIALKLMMTKKQKQFEFNQYNKIIKSVSNEKTVDFSLFSLKIVEKTIQITYKAVQVGVNASQKFKKASQKFKKKYDQKKYGFINIKQIFQLTSSMIKDTQYKLNQKIKFELILLVQLNQFIEVKKEKKNDKEFSVKVMSFQQFQKLNLVNKELAQQFQIARMVSILRFNEKK